jgi:hypothetical protein
MAIETNSWMAKLFLSFLAIGLLDLVNQLFKLPHRGIPVISLFYQPFHKIGEGRFSAFVQIFLERPFFGIRDRYP